MHKNKKNNILFSQISMSTSNFSNVSICISCDIRMHTEEQFKNSISMQLNIVCVFLR